MRARNGKDDARVRDELQDWDPALRHGPIPEERVARIRRTLLAAAARGAGTPPVPARRAGPAVVLAWAAAGLALGAAAILAGLFGLWGGLVGTPQVAVAPPQLAAAPAPLRLEFHAANGTRIFWTLSPAPTDKRSRQGSDGHNGNTDDSSGRL